jgi:hypothetical protein
MFPNMIVHFLYEEQRRKDEIRQIQLENEYHRALRNGSSGNGRSWKSLGAGYRGLTARLAAMVRHSSQKTSKAGLESTGPDACPDPCFAA